MKLFNLFFSLNLVEPTEQAMSSLTVNYNSSKQPGTYFLTGEKRRVDLQLYICY